MLLLTNIITLSSEIHIQVMQANPQVEYGQFAYSFNCIFISEERLIFQGMNCTNGKLLMPITFVISLLCLLFLLGLFR